MSSGYSTNSSSGPVLLVRTICEEGATMQTPGPGSTLRAGSGLITPLQSSFQGLSEPTVPRSSDVKMPPEMQFSLGESFSLEEVTSLKSTSVCVQTKQPAACSKEAPAASRQTGLTLSEQKTSK